MKNEKKNEVFEIDTSNAIIPDIPFEVGRKLKIGVVMKDDNLRIRSVSSPVAIDIDISLKDVFDTIKRIKELK